MRDVAKCYIFVDLVKSTVCSPLSVRYGATVIITIITSHGIEMTIIINIITYHLYVYSYSLFVHSVEYSMQTVIPMGIVSPMDPLLHPPPSKHKQC